jgi:hypothetical protein
MAHQISQEVRRCIDDCLECYSICTETVDHCLELGGKHAEPKHIRLLLDCAKICQASGDFMLRSSNFHPRTCAVCAEICQRCADECERLANGDDLMRRCAEICRRCAESCKKMGAMATV